MRLLCMNAETCRNMASEPRRRDGLCDECRERLAKRRNAERAVAAAKEAVVEAAEAWGEAYHEDVWARSDARDWLRESVAALRTARARLAEVSDG